VLLGHVDTVSRRLVEGWAVVPERADELLAVEIRVDGDVVACVDVGIDRPDLKEFVPASVMHPRGFRFVFEPPLSPFRPVEISVSVVGCEAQLADSRRLIPAPLPAAAAMTPILLTSAGRSGTTLLMREFLTHPDIVVADLFPYEIKLMAYYAAAFRTLAANEDRENSTDPEELFDGPNRHRIGHNPYNSPGFFKATANSSALRVLFERKYPQELANLFRRTILDYYAVLRNDQNKAAARFFAEKGDINAACREGARMFFGRVREIVVVRDPRDLLCSAKAFWKLGSNDALGRLEHTLRGLAEIGASPDDDTHILRYEDLITAPDVARARLHAFIGTAAPCAAADTTSLFAQHGTSATADASVARWRQELSPEEIAACEATFAGYMRLFGYVDGQSLRATRSAWLISGSAAEQHLQALGRDPDEQIRVFGFDAGSPSNARLLEGFSTPETSSVWSNGRHCTVHLPLAGFRARAVSLVIKPYIIPGDASPLPWQRVTASAMGRRFETLSVRGFSVLTCDLGEGRSSPPETLVIELDLPDASRPADLEPGHADTRLLGIELFKVVLHGTPVDGGVTEVTP
jgi:hypothetical protein